MHFRKRAALPGSRRGLKRQHEPRSANGRACFGRCTTVIREYPQSLGWVSRVSSVENHDPCCFLGFVIRRGKVLDIRRCHRLWGERSRRVDLAGQTARCLYLSRPISSIDPGNLLSSLLVGDGWEFPVRYRGASETWSTDPRASKRLGSIFSLERLRSRG
jgi:hypothetical protein